MARPTPSAHFSPEQLNHLAEGLMAEAGRIKAGPERLRLLTFADAVADVANLTELLLRYERRLLN